VRDLRDSTAAPAIQLCELLAEVSASSVEKNPCDEKEQGARQALTQRTTRWGGT
jgi:hypothetical protein